MTKDLTVTERLLIDQALNFISNMTVKNPSMAKKYETTESAKKSQDYIYAIENGNNCLYEYFDYDENDFINIGITDFNLIFQYKNDKSKVPEDIKSLLLNNKVNDTINNYVELNQYYRQLNGEPPIEDDETEYVYTSLGIPVHQLSDIQFYELEKSGEIERLINENPYKLYLRYIKPENKINYYNARKTLDFYILNYNSYLLEEIYVKELIDYYYQVLVYTTSVVYTKAFGQQEYYDSYIIMYMLTATLQKFFANHIMNVIRRDLYDIDSVRNMFLSYGLPFFEDIPLKYQRKVLKNLNKILSYKGTDKVLVNLTEIFGFTDTQLYRYYLIKDFKRDNKTGEIILDDPTGDGSNFDLKFAQVALEDKDISSYLNTNFLYQSYSEVVGGDPYWGMNEDGEIDEDLIKEIKSYDFNYISTKYLSVGTIFNMSQSTFETCYFINMIKKMQNDGLLDDFVFYNTEIKANGTPLKLFDVLTGIFILLFRRFGYSDNFNYTPTRIASIYGFNFDNDLEGLKDYIYKSSEVDIEGVKLHYNENDEIIKSFLKVLEMPNNPTKEKLLNEYFSDKKFNDALHYAMNNTDDIVLYRSLNAIHTYNMYSNSLEELYGQNNDIQDIKTYSDYLRDNDRFLADLIDHRSLNSKGEIDLEGTIKCLNLLLEGLELYFNSSEFTNLFVNTNVTLDLVRNYLLEMISVFKAYTVEIKKINIYYMFDDQYLNTLRLFIYMKKSINMSKADSLSKYMIDDLVKNVNMYFNNDDLLGLENYIETFINILKDDKFNITDNAYIDILREFAQKIDLDDVPFKKVIRKFIDKELIKNNDLFDFLVTINKQDLLSIRLSPNEYFRRSIYADRVKCLDYDYQSINMNIYEENKLIEDNKEELYFYYS